MKVPLLARARDPATVLAGSLDIDATPHWACAALAQICFDNAANCISVVRTPGMLSGLRSVMENSSKDSKAAAALAVNNISAFSEQASTIIVQADLLSLNHASAASLARSLPFLTPAQCTAIERTRLLTRRGLLLRGLPEYDRWTPSVGSHESQMGSLVVGSRQLGAVPMVGSHQSLDLPLGNLARLGLLIEQPPREAHRLRSGVQPACKVNRRQSEGGCWEQPAGCRGSLEQPSGSSGGGTPRTRHAPARGAVVARCRRLRCALKRRRRQCHFIIQWCAAIICELQRVSLC